MIGSWSCISAQMCETILFFEVSEVTSMSMP